jgi:uncharacterized RDD family membrane protein YckC
MKETRTKVLNNVGVQKYRTGFPRLIALFIDSFFLGIILSSLQRMLQVPNSTIPFFILSTIPYIYSIFCHFKYGQTIGKAIMKIKVLTVEEIQLSIKHAVLRDCVPLIFLVFGLITSHSLNEKNFEFTAIDYVSIIWGATEIITMLFNNKRRAIHDFIAGTVVVKL